MRYARFVVAVLVLSSGMVAPNVAQQSRPAAGVPSFAVDPSWPKPLPNNMALGPVSTIEVDSRDHIWVLHRPKGVPNAAPAVLEFDQDGNYLQGWGAPGTGYEWPETGHSVFVDANSNVWITGDTQVLKFTREGKFLLQIGRAGKSAGSNDKTLLGRTPAGVAVDTAAHEVFIADGYQNHRVIVFDSESGAYKRHWGAYGKPPEDPVDYKYDPAAPPSSQFANPVHCVRIARDGLMYVCDRINDRVQIFRKDGTFVSEALIEKETGPYGSVWDIAFSPDQKLMYLADGTNQKVLVLVRDTMQIVGSFGHAGKLPGEFTKWVHGIAVDSKGNIYTAEVNEGKRAQKFVYKGLTSN